MPEDKNEQEFVLSPAAHDSVSPDQRFTPDNPCPVCDGHQSARKRSAEHCGGFWLTNGNGVVCTNVPSAHSSADGYLHWTNSDAWADHQVWQDTLEVSSDYAWDDQDDDWAAYLLNKHEGVFAAEYTYRDENGTAIRTKFRRKNGGKYWDSSNGVKIDVPYRLPELIEEQRRGGEAAIADGEKDVEALRRQGITATCAPHGMSSWKPKYGKYLVGLAKVTIVRDKEAKGPQDALRVKESVPDGVEVEIVEAKNGKDAYDHFEAGHTFEDFVPVADDDLPLLKLSDVIGELYKLRVRDEARRRFNSEIAGGTFKFSAPGWTLKDELDLPDTEPIYRVEGLQTTGGNVLLVATYKAGKTILVLNLAKALVDGGSFLGKYEVTPLEGKVAIWNYELTRAMWNRWARDLGVQNQDRIVVEHLRGRGITPIWDPDFQERAVEWMLANEIQFWILDPTAVAWRGLMQGEGDNIGAATFLAAVDEVKQQAGITESILTHHTGRVEQKEDEERARGATRLEDWMDSGWYLTKEREQRYFRAQGRDVDQEPLALNYNEDTREVTVSGLTKQEAREDAGRHAVVEAMVRLAKRGNERPTTRDLTAAITMDRNKRSAAIASAADAQWIKRTTEGQTKYCELTLIGRRYYEKAQPK